MDMLLRAKGRKSGDFEELLVNMFGLGNLVKRHVREEGIPLTLYYIAGADVQYLEGEEYVFDLHIATWTKGEAWVFKHAEPHLVMSPGNAMKLMAERAQEG